MKRVLSLFCFLIALCTLNHTTYAITTQEQAKAMSLKQFKMKDQGRRHTYDVYLYADNLNKITTTDYAQYFNVSLGETIAKGDFKLMYFLEGSKTYSIYNLDFNDDDEFFINLSQPTVRLIQNDGILPDFLIILQSSDAHGGYIAHIFALAQDGLFEVYFTNFDRTKLPFTMNTSDSISGLNGFQKIGQNLFTVYQNLQPSELIISKYLCYYEYDPQSKSFKFLKEEHWM